MMKGIFVVVAAILVNHFAVPYNIDDVYKGVEGIFKRLLQMEKRVQNIETTVVDMKTEIENVKNNINVSMEKVSTDMGNLKSDIHKVENNIAEVQSDITEDLSQQHSIPGWKFIGRGTQNSSSDSIAKSDTSFNECIQTCEDEHYDDDAWNGMVWEPYNGWCECFKNDEGHDSSYFWEVHFRIDA